MACSPKTTRARKKRNTADCKPLRTQVIESTEQQKISRASAFYGTLHKPYLRASLVSSFPVKQANPWLLGHRTSLVGGYRSCQQKIPRMWCEKEQRYAILGELKLMSQHKFGSLNLLTTRPSAKTFYRGSERAHMAL